MTPRVDVATAFRVLRGEVSRTGVARDARMQKFHERPGLRRKRLRGERWRKAFNEGFYAVLERVRELRRQGW